MAKKIILLSVLFLFIAGCAFADTLTLKSGQQIEGKIIEKNSDSVRIDSFGVELTYFLKEIDQINGEKIGFAAKEVNPQVIEEAKPQVPSSAEADKKITEVPAVPEDKKEPQSLFQQYPKQGNKPAPLSIPQRADPKLKKAKVALTMGVVLVLFFIFAVSYAYSAFCLQLIAQKASQGPLWLAWVPVANLFLMCKIAGLKYQWLLILLASFIPFSGPVAIAVFFVFLCYKIALSLNKPAWLGILMLVPLANFVVMGYLAFSD